MPRSLCATGERASTPASYSANSASSAALASGAADAAAAAGGDSGAAWAGACAAASGVDVGAELDEPPHANAQQARTIAGATGEQRMGPRGCGASESHR